LTRVVSRQADRRRWFERWTHKVAALAATTSTTLVTSTSIAPHTGVARPKAIPFATASFVSRTQAIADAAHRVNDVGAELPP